MSLANIIAIGKIAFAEFPIISGLTDDLSTARDILNKANPALIPRIEANAGTLLKDVMKAIDPVGLTVVAKVAANKPLTDDEKRWMDRASASGG